MFFCCVFLTQGFNLVSSIYFSVSQFHCKSGWLPFICLFLFLFWHFYFILISYTADESGHKTYWKYVKRSHVQNISPRTLQIFVLNLFSLISAAPSFLICFPALCIDGLIFVFHPPYWLWIYKQQENGHGERKHWSKERSPVCGVLRFSVSLRTACPEVSLCHQTQGLCVVWAELLISVTVSVACNTSRVPSLSWEMCRKVTSGDVL